MTDVAMHLPHLFASPPRRAFASRREFLRQAGSGCGLLALAALLDDQGLLAHAQAAHAGRAAQSAGAAAAALSGQGQERHLAVHERRPSQVDTWDYKPELAKRDGKELEGFDKNTGFFTDQVGPLMKSPFKFAQHGQSGTWVSEIFPEHGRARRRHGVHPLVLHRDEQPLAGPVQDQHRHEPDGLSRASAPGSPTAWGARTRTCPASS